MTIHFLGTSPTVRCASDRWNVYTIRSMQFGIDPITHVYDLGFPLEEISGPRKANGSESGFFHTRFVPWLEADSVVASAVEQRDACEATGTLAAASAEIVSLTGCSIWLAAIAQQSNMPFDPSARRI